MNENNEKPDILELATKASVQEKNIPLKEFFLNNDLYRLRSEGEFEKSALQPLIDSLALEGQQTPIEVFYDENDRPIPTKGYRRLNSMLCLANENHPRFTLDMQVWAQVVSNATPQDLLLRAVLDNETRKNFTQLERIMIVKRLHKAGVPVQRAAAALGVGLKTYERDRMLAEHEWMLDLAKKNAIGLTSAAILLEVATKEGLLKELENDLKEWVTYVQNLIEEKARLRKLLDGAELRSNEMQVKSYMVKGLVDLWISQIRKKERFAKDVQWEFGAGIDADSSQLNIQSLSMDLLKAPLKDIAKVVSKLSQVSKNTLRYLKTRYEIEAPKGAQDIIRSQSDQPYDLDVLREEGLDQLAIDLENDAQEDGEPKTTTDNLPQDNLVQ